MALDQSNSTMEMGTSDQELVAAKKKKRTAYIAGTVVMLIVIGLVVAAVVALSRNESGDSDELINTTEGPTTLPPITEPSTTNPPTDATTVPGTEVPSEPAPLETKELNEGAYSPSLFSGTWVSGSEFMDVDDNSNLILHNAFTGQNQVLLANSSTVFQNSTRNVKRSADGTTVMTMHGVVSVYRYSTLAHYIGVNLQTGDEQVVGPVGVADPYLQAFAWGVRGTSMAFVYSNNVFYKENLTADAQQITTSGILHVIYHGIPDWVYEEEVSRSAEALWFSPQGTHLVYATFDDTNVRVMYVPHYGVPGSIKHQYTRHDAIRYPKVGTANPTVSVTMVNLATNASTTVQAPTTLDQPILLTVKFVTDNTVSVVWANRVQNQIEVHLCTQNEAACTVIFTHSEPDGWVDCSPLFFNSAGTSFVTVLPYSVGGERWKQVVQVSAGAAGVAWILQGRSNTRHSVAEILAWTDSDVVWYKATRESDSAELHVYSVSGEGVVSCFTCDVRHSSGASCLYSDALLSTDGTALAVTCAGPAVPQVYLYSTAGARLSVWEDNAALSSLLKSRSMPALTRLSVPVQDSLPDAQVLIQHPHNVENLSDVPLLVYVYAGPDSAQVTHSWAVDWGSTLVSRWGIAVAHIDGRGSGLKGINNLFSINRRFGTLEIEDQISVTKYLQENLPYVDANRTCIWGWSYGGYVSTLALARVAGVFRCAIAVAPVTDWKYYDSIYTERYMDTPANNQEAYTNSSILNADAVTGLRGKRYFLVHGTADDNVHYQQSMLLSRLLQVNDIYFHQMSYTDEKHALSGVASHFYHALEHFLQENML